jgi:hypothetical protein
LPLTFCQLLLNTNFEFVGNVIEVTQITEADKVATALTVIFLVRVAFIFAKLSLQEHSVFLNFAKFMVQKEVDSVATSKHCYLRAD